MRDTHSELYAEIAEKVIVFIKLDQFGTVKYEDIIANVKYNSSNVDEVISKLLLHDVLENTHFGIRMGRRAYIFIDNLQQLFQSDPSLKSSSKILTTPITNKKSKRSIWMTLKKIWKVSWKFMVGFAILAGLALTLFQLWPYLKPYFAPYFSN